MPGDDILIETKRVGAAIEVRAVSTRDGLEVSFVAPLSAGMADIQKLALAKLIYVKSKGSPGGSTTGGRGGVLA